MNLGHLLEVELPQVSEDLGGLGPVGWHLWPYGDQEALVRRLDDDRYVAIIPFIFTWGVVVGTTHLSYDDRWCYHHLPTAVAAAHVWDGTGEPDGWHRHPTSGRRRPNGDPEQEYINP